MARRSPRPEATHHVVLRPTLEKCEGCGEALWVAHHKRRTVTTLQGIYDLRLVVRQCPNSQCQEYHHRYRPEEEGSWALPHGEFGLDVIALVGALRFREHRSVPEIHQELLRRGVQIAERSVAHLIARYEELVTVHVTDRDRIHEKLTAVRGSIDLIHETGRSIRIWQRIHETCSKKGQRRDQVRDEALLPRFKRTCSESSR